MSKKKLYSITAIIFITFIIAFILIVINKPKESDSSTLLLDNYAINETKEKEEESTESITYEKTVNGITYTNFENLNYEQQASKDDLILLIKKSIANEEAINGKAKLVEILESSSDYFTYILVTFSNDITQEYILVYDNVTTHSFLNCQTIEVWDYYHSDKNKG